MDFCAYVPPRHDGSPRFGMFGLADSREGRNFAGNRWGVIFLRKSRAVKQELWLELFPVSKLLACGARLSQPSPRATASTRSLTPESRDLSDAQWQILDPLLPEPKRRQDNGWQNFFQLTIVRPVSSRLSPRCL